MGGLREYLKGKKTYLTGLAALVGATTAWISGGLTDVEFVQSVVATLMMLFIRAGVHTEAERAAK